MSEHPTNTIPVPAPNESGGYTFQYEDIEPLKLACGQHAEIESSGIYAITGWVVRTTDGRAIIPAGVDVLTFVAAIIHGAPLPAPLDDRTTIKPSREPEPQGATFGEVDA